MGRRREPKLIPFLVKAAKLKTYGSCLEYSEKKRAFKPHLPRKSKITCSNCFRMLKDWNLLQKRNIQNGDYSVAKHAFLRALNKTLYADCIHDGENGSWFKVLSDEKILEKRQRKSKKATKNAISLPSPGSEGYGTNSSGYSDSANQDSCESGCLNNITNSLSNNQEEWEIEQQHSIMSQPSTSEGYDSSYYSPQSTNPHYDENRSINRAENFSDVESGIESPMSSDDLNSTTNGNFYETYHNPNGVDSETLFSGPENIMEIDAVYLGFDAIVQADIDIRNATPEHIFGNVGNPQQFEVSGNGREIPDADQVVQDGLTNNISDAEFNSLLEELGIAHCLSNENNAGTNERFSGVMYYKLIGESPLEETVLLILKPMGEVLPDSESNLLPLYWMCEELDCYEPFNITPNMYGYFKIDVINKIRSSQVTEIKKEEGHILYFLKPSQTISPRIYSPITESLN